MLGKITPMREGTAVGRLFGALRSNKQTQRAFVGQVVCGCLALFLLWGAWNNKCNMEANLMPVMTTVDQVLKELNIPYFLQFGTLLGGFRERGIINSDYDLDIGIMQEDCDRLMETKDAFLAKGYEVYDRSTYIPYKGYIVNGWNSYIHTPCGRIYSPQIEYYVDIYGHFLVSAEQASTGVGVNPEVFVEGSIPEWAKEGEGADLMCNAEECYKYKDILPLGEEELHGHMFPAPANAAAVLEVDYGPDFMTPEAKGYKALFCELPAGYMLGMALVFVCMGCWLAKWTCKSKEVV